MPLFRCSQCGVVDNTAMGTYWMAVFKKPSGEPPLCTECDPTIGKWHGAFPRSHADEEFVGGDGRRYRWVVDVSEKLPNILKEVEVDPQPAEKKLTPAQRRRASTKKPPRN